MAALDQLHTYLQVSMLRGAKGVVVELMARAQRGIKLAQGIGCHDFAAVVTLGAQAH